MSLPSGFRIGPYEVLGPLGAGGMGEVYRAHDAKLHRDVALKVLPDLVAGDADRLARFQREAQVLASLNHPNIGGIHGFEEADGIGALVLELVEGPTLADRIAQGPIGLDDALPVARQIADALDSAHDRGIIHRDLKPSNIKLRPDNTVKVLDFGLAKALDATVRSDAAASPTMTSPVVTGAGMILGTATYMAPEQAKGKEVDRRADVWAFGCVLYEMLTGRTAFEGETVSEVLAAVLKTEPDWRRLPADTPEGIRRLLRRCLQKDLRQRLQHIGDARIEINDAQTDSQVDGGAALTASRGRERLAWITAGTLALVAAVMGVWAFRPAPPDAEVRLDITAPPTTDPLSLAIAPDGQKIVFVATSDGRSQLWLRPMDSTSARPLAGSDFALLPFWSPDSRSIGFFADAKLKRIDIESGSVHDVASAAGGMGGTWNRDNTILFAPNITGQIFRISAKGGEPAAVTRTDARQSGHRHPQILPDGRHFLYSATGRPEAVGVYAGGLDGSETSRLLEADTPAIYAPSGHLLFVRQGTLFAQSFDPVRLTLAGNPFRVADRVPGDFRGMAVSASAEGTIVYRAGSTLGHRQFVWVDRSGKELEKVGEPNSASALSPSISLDGRRVAFHRIVNGNNDIWWFDPGRGVFNRITTDSVNDIHPIWSPDGSRIIFASLKKGVYDLYQRSIARDDSEELLLATPDTKRPMDWSPDGRFVLYRSLDPKTGSPDIWALPMEGDGERFPVVQSAFEEKDGQFSPDGKWIAYESNKSGRSEIFVRPFPGPGAESQISINGGAQGRWGRDGREMFYIAMDGRLMAVPIRMSADGQTVDAGAPVSLFATHVGGAVQRLSGPLYMVALDGKRFLMNSLTEDTHTSPITVILNWKGKP